MGFDLYYFFKQLYGSKLNFFSVTLFLVLVVYNTQSHSDGCEIPKDEKLSIGSSVFILLLLGVSLNVI